MQLSSDRGLDPENNRNYLQSASKASQQDVSTLIDLIDRNPLETSLFFIALIKEADACSADDAIAAGRFDTALSEHAQSLHSCLPVIRNNTEVPVEVRRRWLGQMLLFDALSAGRCRDEIVGAYIQGMKLSRPEEGDSGYVSQFTAVENTAIGLADMGMAYVLASEVDGDKGGLLKTRAFEAFEECLSLVPQTSSFAQCYCRSIFLRGGWIAREDEFAEREYIRELRQLVDMARGLDRMTEETLLMQQYLEVDLAATRAAVMLDFPEDINDEHTRQWGREIEAALNRFSGLLVFPHGLGEGGPAEPQLYYDGITLRCALVQCRVLIGAWSEAERDLQDLLSNYFEVSQQNDSAPEEILEDERPFDDVLADLSEPESDEVYQHLMALYALVVQVRDGDVEASLLLLAQAAYQAVFEPEYLESVLNDEPDPQIWLMPMQLLNAAGWAGRHRGDNTYEIIRPLAERCEHIFREVCPNLYWAWDQ